MGDSACEDVAASAYRLELFCARRKDRIVDFKVAGLEERTKKKEYQNQQIRINADVSAVNYFSEASRRVKP